MNGSMIVAVITVSGSVVIAALTFLMNKWYERKDDWHKRKLDHYNKLLSAMSLLARYGDDRIDDDVTEAHTKFAHAVNTIALVAPQYVIDALMTFNDYTILPVQDRPAEKHDYLLGRLLLVIRKDLGVSKNDDPDTFSFHLIASAPPKMQRSKH